jgi:hypothetical protein
MYNKLFSKILDSSIWLESIPTRIMWLTFIAVMDENGFVQFASPANAAHRARISLEEGEEAIRILENPDINSSNPDHGGRRIERVPGGWMVLNAKTHRDMVTRAVVQEQTRERVRRHRAKKHSSNADVTQGNEKLTPSEAEAVTESETASETFSSSSSAGALLAALPTAVMRSSWGAELRAAKQGAHGSPLTDDQIELACRDYLGNGHSAERPSLRHFRAFLKSAGRPAKAETPRAPGQLTNIDFAAVKAQLNAEEAP